VFPFIFYKSKLIQRQDREEILANYTFNHMIKLVNSMLVAGIYFCMLFWDLLCEEEIGISMLIQSFSNGTIWVLASYLLRQEYLNLGFTTLHLRLWWVIALCTQVLEITLVAIFDTKVDFFSDVRPEYVMLLFLLGGIVIIGYIRSGDMPLDRRNTMEAYYEFMLSAYKKQQEPNELQERELWDRFSQVNYLEKQEKIQKRQEEAKLQQKIKKIEVPEYEVVEEEEDSVVYYIIKVYKGRTGNILRETRRRYREFASLYTELRARFPKEVIASFPPRMNTK